MYQSALAGLCFDNKQCPDSQGLLATKAVGVLAAGQLRSCSASPSSHEPEGGAPL